MVAVAAESIVGGTRLTPPDTDSREFSSGFRPQSYWRTSGATMSSRQITGAGVGSTNAFSSGTFNYNNGVSKYCYQKSYTAHNTDDIFCDVNANVVANPVSSQCVQQQDNASATVNSGVVNPTWKATAVSATSDNIITITVQPTWLGNTYYNEARSALLGCKTNNPGNIYWHFTISCTGGTQTVNGTQQITCPGP